MLTIDALAAVSPTIAGPVAIGCQLAMPARLTRKQPAMLTLTVRNHSKHTVQLLKRNTPLEGWLADSMIVERDGQPVPYSGAMAKRMPPTAAEYLRLKPAAIHQHRVALQRAYDVSLPGVYQIRWNGELMDAHMGGGAVDLAQPKPQTLTCNAVTFTRLP